LVWDLIQLVKAHSSTFYENISLPDVISGASDIPMELSGLITTFLGHPLVDALEKQDINLEKILQFFTTVFPVSVEAPSPAIDASSVSSAMVKASTETSPDREIT
jgi:hypothetical protein